MNNDEIIDIWAEENNFGSFDRAEFKELMDKARADEREKLLKAHNLAFRVDKSTIKFETAQAIFAELDELIYDNTPYPQNQTSEFWAKSKLKYQSLKSKFLKGDQA